PQQYHDFIGFQVAVPLLKRAFRDTYGFELTDLFGNLDEAIGSYRRAVSKYIPFFTRVAWAEHRDEIRRTRHGIAKRKFIYIMKRSSYERYWGKTYERPSLWDRVVAFLVKILPPWGPIQTVKFKALTPRAEQIFMRSFDLAVPAYGRAVTETSEHLWRGENINFDLGTPTHAGQYRLQDETYAYWVRMLARNGFQDVTPPIKADILDYYRDRNAPIATKRNKKQWKLLLNELRELRLHTAGALNAGS
ncbi:MAG: zinc dependent phospholipase C family protein, partial [Bryobacteraceae bacterium]